MRTWRTAALIIGMTMVFTGLGHLIPKFVDREDIWWTHRKMPLDLTKAREKVRVLIAGQRLGQHLDAGTLRVAADDGTSRPVRPEDVGFRLNNWDSRRASQYFQAIFSASYLTAGVLLIVAGLVLVPRAALRSRPEAPETAGEAA